MPDVFISYGHARMADAQQVAQALREQGFDVWRDDDLPVHRDYSEVIEERLREAMAVVVLWSSDAVKSHWVRAEAELAREAGTLVQLSLDGAPLPLPFNRIQCADLTNWNGDRRSRDWLKVVASIGDLVAATGDHSPVTAPAPQSLSLPPVSAKPSIAVLPFTNLSHDPEQEYFADAVSEDLITALSRWRSFFVIARNSTFTYKGAAVDVRRVGVDLGVRYVLEGSVRKAGKRVRITAQLIDCANRAHIWADSFDRGLRDILALQDEITEQVVRAIEPAILQSENVRLSHKSIADYSALDCYQRGMWHLNKVSFEDYRQALSLFREAIARDPELALGHIGLSRILYGGATIYAWSSTPDEDLKESHEAALLAIELDPSDSDAYFACSGAALYLGLHEEAVAHARRSVSLNPNSAYGQFRLAQVLIYAGRPADALKPIERSLGRNPFDPQLGAILGTLALAHYQVRNYEEAVTQARTAIGHGFSTAYALLAAALARLGRIEEARESFPPELLARATRDTPRLAPYVNDSDRDHLFGGLMLAGVFAPAGSTR